MIQAPRPLPGRYARAFPSLFGHVDVPFLRHAAGLVGATFAASGLASIVIIAFTGASLAAAGSLSSHWSAGTLFTLIGALWAMLMIMLFPAAGLLFTAAHAALRLARQNFGLAYIVLGWIAGWLTATATATRVNAGAAVALGTCGLLLGIAYWWLVARQSAPTVESTSPAIAQPVNPAA